MTMHLYQIVNAGELVLGHPVESFLLVHSPTIEELHVGVGPLAAPTVISTPDVSSYPAIFCTRLADSISDPHPVSIHNSSIIGFLM